MDSTIQERRDARRRKWAKIARQAAAEATAEAISAMAAKFQRPDDDAPVYADDPLHKVHRALEGAGCAE